MSTVESCCSELASNVAKLCASLLAALLVERAPRSEVFCSNLEEHREFAANGGRGAGRDVNNDVSGCARKPCSRNRAPMRDAFPKEIVSDLRRRRRGSVSTK